MWSSRLADCCLAIHFAWVFFVLFVVPVVIVGWICRWAWVRNSWFRNIHLAMIALVVLETALNIECPLTRWERELRAVDGVKAEERGCIQYWMRTILFVQVSTDDLAISYVSFGIAVALLFVAVPPRWLEKYLPARNSMAKGGSQSGKVDEGLGDRKIDDDSSDVHERRHEWA